jgi:hypothetical protein
MSNPPSTPSSHPYSFAPSTQPPLVPPTSPSDLPTPHPQPYPPAQPTALSQQGPYAQRGGAPGGGMGREGETTPPGGQGTATAAQGGERRKVSSSAPKEPQTETAKVDQLVQVRFSRCSSSCGDDSEMIPCSAARIQRPRDLTDSPFALCSTSTRKPSPSSPNPALLTSSTTPLLPRIQHPLLNRDRR